MLKQFFFVSFVLGLNSAHAADCEIVMVAGGQNTFDRMKKDLPKYEKIAGCQLVFKRISAELSLENMYKDRADILIAGPIAAVQKLASERTDLPKLEAVDLEDALINPIPVTALVHSDNPVSKIKPADMSGILTGKITNWQKLGGKDQEIKVFFAKDKTNINNAILAKFLKGETLVENETTLDQLGLARAIRKHTGGIGFMPEKTVTVDDFTPKTFDSGASIDLYMVFKKNNSKPGVKKLAEHFRINGPLSE